MRASFMAYNFFMAIFPAIIFFFTLIAYFPIHDLHEGIMQYIKHLMPADAFSAVESTLNDILTIQHGSLLSIGFISAMLFSANAVFNMFKAFDKYDNSPGHRSVLRRLLLSLAMTLIFSVLLILSVVLITFGQIAIDWMESKHWLNDNITYYSLIVLQWVVTLSIFYLVISFSYYFGSSLKPKFKLITPGATLATIVSIIATVGFAFYVNNFGSYNRLYGSIGTLLIVLILIYTNCLIILYGYELNASIDKARKHHLKPAEMTAANLEQSVEKRV